MRPVVSVVMANYNGAAWLEPAIASVLGQALDDLELIIVDDASSDDSLGVMKTAAAGDSRVRVIVQPANAGPGAARNRALDAAEGRWIAVVDSDDLMDPDRLSTLVARGDQDGADIVVDNLAVFESGAPQRAQPFLHWRDARWIDLEAYLASARMYSKRPGLGYLKPLFRAAALGATRYREDLRIGEDYDLVVRLLVQGCRLRFDPASGYHYRRHGSSISHTMRRDHLLQMLAADGALEGVMMSQPKAVRSAFAARRRSLHAALAYDDVIARLKARDLAGGLAAGLSAPEAWPLLTMPVTARLKRLAARVMPQAAATT
jgi:succinoglycan biosynthesis protein ExoO